MKFIVHVTDFIAWTTVFKTYVSKAVSAVDLKPKQAKKRVFNVQKTVFAVCEPPQTAKIGVPPP